MATNRKLSLAAVLCMPLTSLVPYKPTAFFYNPVALQPYIPTALQPYNSTALQPYIPTALQPYSLTTLQPYIPTALHPYSLTTLQPYMPTALQPYSLTTLQSYNPTALHPYSLTSLEPYIPTAGSSLSRCANSEKLTRFKIAADMLMTFAGEFFFTEETLLDHKTF